MPYTPADIEAKWQAQWDADQTYAVPNPGQPGFDPNKPKFYVLDMFPYPSGVGLHVGHPLGFIATDVLGRFKRMTGHSVLHPMGFDAFGLPAEQYAIETNVHPRVTTEKNIANMVRQLKALGMGYDWDRSLATTDPGYVRWTQWIFLQLYHSYFDPTHNKAMPIAHLLSELEGENYYIGLDGELIPSGADEDLEALTGGRIGVHKWYELTPDQQTRLLDEYRLAYLADVEVNWCPQLGTVLANEEVTADGKSERGNFPVVKRPLKQWMLRITAYADRLIEGLETVKWPEAIKNLQRNWIGRSEGALVDFPTVDADESIRVFTTRPDTLFGATYVVLAPEHPLVDVITTDRQRDAVKTYQTEAAAKSQEDRGADDKTKTGVFTGAHATNPVNGASIPVWIADYVMMGYGTGAIMAVPAHDTRDFEFARGYGLPLRTVNAPIPFTHENNSEFLTIFDEALNEGHYAVQLWEPKSEKPNNLDTVDKALQSVIQEIDKNAELFRVQKLRSGKFCLIYLRGVDKEIFLRIVNHPKLAGYGSFPLTCKAHDEQLRVVNSANEDVSLNRMPVADAKALITDWLAGKDLGRPQTQYRLRDWLFSRQRYWGEPFPILHGPNGEVRPVDESDLPVELPEMEDFKPTGSDDPDAPPAPPLGRAGDDWKHVTIDGVTYTRELNTMPNWAGSCWYYLRYLDPRNEHQLVGSDAERYWMLSEKTSGGSGGGTHAGGVDLYVGGQEHAVLHLLYARFWHQVLFDLGHVSTPEPFGQYFAQGYIQAYCYRDARGIPVPANEVVNADGKPAAEVQGVKGETFFHNGNPVTEEFGKMGKSLKNAIAPDDVIDQYGADTLRLYEMYLGPLDQSKVWNTADIVGVNRFLHRLWRNLIDDADQLAISTADPDAELRRLHHHTIKRVTDDMARLSFNTAIAALIELNNALVKLDTVPRAIAEDLVKMLGPFAPHLAEELWQRLGFTDTFADAAWPTHNPDYLVQDTVEYPVQVNGKLRGKITVPADADQPAIEAAAKADPNVAEHLDGKTVRKLILIPGRLINFVVS
ncbi:MAG: class I tRNA ligase family protein [Planctomycetota bacterium]